MIELNVLSAYQLSKFLLLFFIAFFTTFTIIPLLIKFARRYNVLDIPDKNLKTHKQKTPYLGGIAIYLGFLIALFISFLFNFKVNINSYFIIGMSILLIVGLVDDIFILKPLQKFIGQIISAIFLLKSVINLDLGFNFIFYPIILLWFLTSMNAFNFLDVMDGLATIVAILSSAVLLIYSIIWGKISLAVLLLCFLGSLFAFFYYNKPTAKIYMGDAGSLFIGGFLSFIGLFFKDLIFFKPSYIFIFFLIYFVPMVELLSLICIRVYNKIPFYLGSPHHFSIYLLKKGWTKTNVLAFVTFLSIVSFVVSLFFIFNFISFIKLVIYGFLLLSYFITITYIKP